MGKFSENTNFQTRLNADDVSMQEVLGLVQPSIKKRASMAGEMSIMCPISPKLSLDINLSDGVFKCWRECAHCPVHGKGKAVNLYRLFHPSLGFGEACEEIAKQRLNPPSTISVQKMKKYEAPPKVAELDQAPVSERNKTYRQLLSYLTLTKAHRINLRKRGLTDSQIDEIGIKSIPTCGLFSIPAKLQKHGCVLNGVPFFGIEKNAWKLCTIKGKTGFFIPHLDEHGNVQQLQIRYDVKITSNMTEEQINETKKQRYRWATSAGYKDGCSAGNVNHYGRTDVFQNSKVLFITEGALKATVASYLSEQWFASIVGVSCYDAFRSLIIWAKARGVETFVDAFDSDRFEKDKVMLAINKLHEIAAEEGVTLTAWSWPSEYKGCDDYLAAMVQAGLDYVLPTFDNENTLLPIGTECIELPCSFITTPRFILTSVFTLFCP